MIGRYDCTRISGLLKDANGIGPKWAIRTSAPIRLHELYGSALHRGFLTSVRPVRHLAACSAIVDGGVPRVSRGCGDGALRCLRCQVRVIGLVVAGDRPGNACRLVGQRDDCDIDVLAFSQLPDPVAEVILPAFAPSECRASPMN